MTEINTQESSNFLVSPKTLTEKLAHYELLVEKNEVGLLSIEDKIITYANDSFARVLRKPLSEIIGHNILDFVKEEDKMILAQGITEMESGEKEMFSYDLRLNHPSDHPIYFSLHLKVTSNSLAPLLLTGASRDASSRVHKSIELNETKAKYEALYRNIIDGIVIYDYINERIIDCNKAALRLLEYDSIDELKKHNRFDFIPKHSNFFPGTDLHKATQEHGYRIINGEAFHTLGVFIGKNKKEVVSNINLVPTFDKKGEAYVIFQDITSMILGKIAQKQSEERYQHIFENSHEAIIFTDLNSGKPIIYNDNTLNLLGASSMDELKDKKLFDFHADPFIDGIPVREYSKNIIRSALKDGRASFSYRVRRLDGQHIRISGVMVGDKSDPQNPKIITFFRDTTNLYKAQQAIHNKNIELKKYIDSNLQLENFAYFASHDLQTPLRSITSFTQLLQKSLKGRLSENEEEYMNFIVSSSKNMRRLINDLLSYSRVNATGLKIKEINLTELVSLLLEELRVDIEEKQVEIYLENFPEFIHADWTKIRQVFQNLLTNALKFHQPEKRPIIHFTCEQKPQEWLFSIKDNGIGIAPEFQEKIFLLFKRLHGHTEYEGTGIGLAMVKKIITQHGGKIWIESEEGQGTTFWFTIARSISQ